jgi:hypothetical protein
MTLLSTTSRPCSLVIRPSSSILLLLFLPLLTACGYSSTPLYRQGIHTVAVPIFINKTYRREWEDRLTEALDKQIESRTPYKIADQKDADSILSGTIVDIHPDTLTRRTGFNLPRETEYTVVIDFTWKDTRSGRIIVERKNFNRSATDIPQIGERATDAEQLAVERLAAAIVDQLQTDW